MISGLKNFLNLENSQEIGEAKMKVFFVDEKPIQGEYKQSTEVYKKNVHYPNKFVYLEERDLLLVGGQDLQHKDILAVADNCDVFTSDLEESEVVTAGKVNGRKIKWGSVGFDITSPPLPNLQRKIERALL